MFQFSFCMYIKAPLKHLLVLACFHIYDQMNITSYFYYIACYVNLLHMIGMKLISYHQHWWPIVNICSISSGVLIKVV